MWTGIAALGAGGLFASASGPWLVGGALTVGFALLLVGWLAVPATLVVTTRESVLLVRGRRRTYEPVEEQERVPLGSWDATILGDLGLWVPAYWKRHLPPQQSSSPVKLPMS